MILASVDSAPLHTNPVWVGSAVANGCLQGLNDESYFSF